VRTKAVITRKQTNNVDRPKQVMGAYIEVPKRRERGGGIREKKGVSKEGRVRRGSEGKKPNGTDRTMRIKTLQKKI